MSARFADAFADSYASCRAKFVAACQAAGAAQLESVAHRERGPNGEALSLDWAHFGPRDAEGLLVLASGTHGAEGPGGSGIQVASLADGLAKQLPPGVAAVLIHGQNPFGMAWNRRCTEAGVDLNRNFVDFAAPLPQNPGFDELAPLLLPQAPPDSGGWHAASAELLATMARVGLASLAQGQYRHASAPFFGGRQPSWSNRELRKLWTQLGPRRRVIYIDYHSGLGERGRGTLLTPAAEGDATLLRLRELWGEAVLPSDVGGEASYPTYGDLALAVEHSFAGRTDEVIAVAHEFGTLAIGAVLEALRRDHWHWRAAARAGAAHPDREDPGYRDAAEHMREAFAPCDPSWRHDLVSQARAVQTRALAFLAKG